MACAPTDSLTHPHTLKQSTHAERHGHRILGFLCPRIRCCPTSQYLSGAPCAVVHIPDLIRLAGRRYDGRSRCGLTNAERPHERPLKLERNRLAKRQTIFAGIRPSVWNVGRSVDLSGKPASQGSSASLSATSPMCPSAQTRILEYSIRSTAPHKHDADHYQLSPARSTESIQKRVL